MVGSLRIFIPSLSTCFTPRRILAQMSNHLVILIEQSDARAQIGDQQDVLVPVDIRRENEAVELFRCLPSSVNHCSRFIRAVGDDD